MSTVTLRDRTELDLPKLEAIAYRQAPLELHPQVLRAVLDGRRRSEALLATGTACYGVSTGLGRQLSDSAPNIDEARFARNVLLARAAASGAPLPRPVGRATVLLKLVNLLAGHDGVRPALCTRLADWLNSGAAPWIPSLGHGMAGDAIAHCHAFQPLIGVGWLWPPSGHGEPVPAAAVTDEQLPDRKEALALINGTAAAPAYAIDAGRELEQLLDDANAVAAMSMAGAAAPVDSVDAAVGAATAAPGVGASAAAVRRLLDGCDYRSHTLQAPVSYRIVPQVHGALADALAALRARCQECIGNLSNNPLLAERVPGEPGFLSVGTFHNQHLLLQVEQVALALAHTATLSVRRLHRLQDAAVTGLNPQLAVDPPCDAGLVVVHKAALDLDARIKVLAQPLSLHTGESSLGQEDYMAMSIPCIARLYQIRDLARRVLASELLAALVALDQRALPPACRLARLQRLARAGVAPMQGDRPPGPDIERLTALFGDSGWRELASAAN